MLLALDAVTAAFKKTMGSCCIFSGDGDLLPLISALVNEGVFTTVISFDDPNKGDVASRLQDAADNYIHLDAETLSFAVADEHQPIASGQLDTSNLPFGEHIAASYAGDDFKYVKDNQGNVVVFRQQGQQSRVSFKKFKSLLDAKTHYALNNS